MLITDL